MTVENDTEVFYEVRVEPLTGEHIYTDRTGTRAAIRKSGRKLDPMSQWFCPHQWLDADGFVSQELANQYPLFTPVKVRARDRSPAPWSLTAPAVSHVSPAACGSASSVDAGAS
jgi:hypothetical protein